MLASIQKRNWVWRTGSAWLLVVFWPLVNLSPLLDALHTQISSHEHIYCAQHGQIEHFLPASDWVHSVTSDTQSVPHFDRLQVFAASNEALAEYQEHDNVFNTAHLACLILTPPRDEWLHLSKHVLSDGSSQHFFTFVYLNATMAKRTLWRLAPKSSPPALFA